MKDISVVQQTKNNCNNTGNISKRHALFETLVSTMALELNFTWRSPICLQAVCVCSNYDERQTCFKNERKTAVTTRILYPKCLHSLKLLCPPWHSNWTSVGGRQFVYKVCACLNYNVGQTCFKKERKTTRIYNIS